MTSLLKIGCFGLCVVLGVAVTISLIPKSTRAASLGLVDGLWVMKKVDERYEGDDLQQELYLTLERVKQKGAAIRKMEVRWLEKDFGKQKGLVIHFLAPDYARGVTLSMTVKPYMDDDRWLYFPDTNIIRRVQARDQFSNFMGTDFTYYDLAEREPDEENHMLLGVEDLGGTTCYVVETMPKERLPNGVLKADHLGRQGPLLKLRIHYFNAAGQLQKQFEADRWQEIDGVWTPLLMVMEDLWPTTGQVSRGATSATTEGEGGLLPAAERRLCDLQGRRVLASSPSTSARRRSGKRRGFRPRSRPPLTARSDSRAVPVARRGDNEKNRGRVSRPGPRLSPELALLRDIQRRDGPGGPERAAVAPVVVLPGAVDELVVDQQRPVPGLVVVRGGQAVAREALGDRLESRKGSVRHRSWRPASRNRH